jgi:hypothetical protein
MFRDLSSVLVWRLIAAASSLVGNVLLTRMIVNAYGIDSFAAIALVMAVPTLLPFADLGLGGALVNYSSDLKAGTAPDVAKRGIAAAVRLLAMSASLFALTSVVFLATGAWTRILGPATMGVSGIELGASLILITVALSLLNAISARTLQGWRKNAFMIAVSAAGPPLALLFASVLVSIEAPPGLLAVPTSLVTLMVAGFYWIPVLRHYPDILRDIWRTRPTASDYKGVLSIGVSGLTISLCMIATLQSDRLLLSFLASPRELATYSLIAPLYAACWAIANPLALNLWPKYRQELASGTARTSNYARDVALFILIGCVGAVGLIVVGPTIVGVMAGNSNVEVPITLYLAFGLLLLVQTAQLPSAMLLTDAGGFKSQRNVSLVMMAVKLLLATLLVAQFGAVAAVMSTVAAVLLIQTPVLARLSVSRIRNSHPPR